MVKEMIWDQLYSFNGYPSFGIGKKGRLLFENTGKPKAELQYSKTDDGHEHPKESLLPFEENEFTNHKQDRVSHQHRT